MVAQRPFRICVVRLGRNRGVVLEFRSKRMAGSNSRGRNLVHGGGAVFIIKHPPHELIKMKTKYTIRTIVAQIGDGLRLGVGSGLFLCLLLSPLVHGQGAQRQWGGETLTSLGGAEYQSPKFGRVSMTGNPATSNLGWVPGLGSFLEAKANGRWSSAEYGEVERGNANAGWAVSSRFGWTHFAPNAETYGGWTWTERFQWMKFERPGNAVYLWVPMMNSWMSVNGDGSFYSFEWRTLTPQGLNRYQSSIFGGLTTGDFGWG